MQILYYRQHLITEENQKTLPNGTSVILSIGLHGGMSNCEICYESATHFCKDCQRAFCSDCCTKYHKHPSRLAHSPHVLACNSAATSAGASNMPCSFDEDNCNSEEMSSRSDHSINSWDDESISSSPNTSALFQEASMIMTLSEKFDVTRFKPYQKEVINAVLSARDCLVIQPTGSGKSMCFQFPAVYKNKMAFVIVPSISLMQDHVKSCGRYGIKAEFLGSAQPDLQAEDRVLSCDSDVNIVLVTPEWLANTSKKEKLKYLVENDKVCLIALDEAHLFHYWQEFRPAYKNLDSLHREFPNIPLMCLTATAPYCVEQNMRRLLRNPLLSRNSVNRPNIFLACEEIPSHIQRKDFSYFASRISDLISEGECTIVYTDFIDDVGPIMSELSEKGIDSVAYYGEMDIKA